jgi:galactokinase
MQFQRVFGTLPQTTASAPGRVNLLGEHTDYNDGFVLPTAIPQCTTVEIGFSSDALHHFYSAEYDELINYSDEDTIPQQFVSYICGCLRLLEKEGYKVPPINLYITSKVPIGAGLSSSAALEIATLRGLRALLDLPLEDVRLAQIGQQAEIQYAGLNCGIMDQMASSLADTNTMLFIDTRSLECRAIPFPPSTEILIIDSGESHKLAAGSGYNQRRAECEESARILGVKALRDIADPQAVEVLPEPLRRRARHVVTENKPRARSGKIFACRAFWRVNECFPRESARRLRSLGAGSRRAGGNLAVNPRSLWRKADGRRFWRCLRSAG